MNRWRGGSGDDLFQADEAVFARGGRGDDNLTGSDDADILLGGKGDDMLTGGIGDDALYGGAGDDVLTDDHGDNTISGGAGDDLIIDGHSDYVGHGGYNLIDGGEGYDVVRCDSRYAALRLQSIEGVERIEGNRSESSGGSVSYTHIDGAKGADRLDFSTVELVDVGEIDGRAGDDTIIGSSGRDHLMLGLGTDVLTGGGARDIFDLGGPGASSPDSPDTITDFRSGKDKLDVSWIDTDPDVTGYQRFTYIGDVAFSGRNGELRFEVCGCGDTVVEGDVNGDGAGDFLIILSGRHVLSSADFIL
jgi:serralysin